MDEEKLLRANDLKKSISNQEQELEKIDDARSKAAENPKNCHLCIYQTCIYPGTEIFEIALTLYEKQVVKKLEQLEKEFAEL